MKSKLRQKETVFGLLLCGSLLLNGCGSVSAGSTAVQATAAPAEETVMPEEADGGRERERVHDEFS